jgi:hypothetical protein
MEEYNKTSNINIVMICPHCSGNIIIENIDNGLIRHGIFINSGKQLSPFCSKEQCEKYVLCKLIYGCGKLLSIRKTNNNNYMIELYDE